MGTHVIEATRQAPSVDKTVLVGTVCSYPKFTPVPFREESLWDGYPEETNAPYGLAKKAHLVHAQVNAAQYGQRFAYLIPTNLYGPGDKFDPRVSHVIPALIKKCVEAVEAGEQKVEVWGTGRASREYLYVDDAAEAIVLAAEVHDGTEPINLGSDHEITIRETAETIARLVGFDGELRWDPSKPDGQPRRRVDASRAEQLLGWRARTSFEDGLRATIDWYLANRERANAIPTDPTRGFHGTRGFADRRGCGKPSDGSGDAGGDGDLSVPRGERIDGLVGVESARIRDHPQLGGSERLRLATEGRPRLVKGGAVRRDPGDGDDVRTVLGGEVAQPLPSLAQLIGRDLRRPRRRPGHQVGDPDPTIDEVTAVVVGHPDAPVDRPVDHAPRSNAG